MLSDFGSVGPNDGRVAEGLKGGEHEVELDTGPSRLDEGDPLAGSADSLGELAL